MNDFGFRQTKPKIKRITFQKRDLLTLHLEDGRLISAPLACFPGIVALSPSQRRQYHIADDNIILFRDDDEVYHIQDFLGTYETNAYESPNAAQKLQTDYLADFRRIIISMGGVEDLPVNENLFFRLTDQWELDHSIPDDLIFHRIPTDDIISRLKKSSLHETKHKFHLPNGIICGEVQGEQGFTGFSAIFRDQGWLVLPSELSERYKYLYTNILVASIGLEYAYPKRQELLVETERLALASMLPQDEMVKLFGLRLSTFPESYREEVANHFNVPFDYVLKRANHLGLLLIKDYQGIQSGLSNSEQNKYMA